MKPVIRYQSLQTRTDGGELGLNVIGVHTVCLLGPARDGRMCSLFMSGRILMFRSGL